MSTYKCSKCGYENEPSAKFCGNCGGDISLRPIGGERVGTTLLGRYTIRRVAAVGGMGVVYEADQSLGDYHRTVAIKTLRPDLSQDPVVVSRFNRECGIVAQLTHQNTVSLYDYGTTEDGTLYIAMEYVRGESFAEAIQKGALSLERTLPILEQMCHSLEEAHTLGIVHRDLKPDNVILTQHGAERDFVKLLDFGIAVRLSVGTNHETKLTQQGMILGTPPYMSPEQFTGAPVMRQSDIYSLGIIAYEALTGHLPFEADSPWMWAQRHLTSVPPELPSTFPEAVVNVVRSALSKDPTSRPRTANEFARMLRGDTSIDGAGAELSNLGLSDRVRTEPDASPVPSNVAATSRFDSPVARTDPTMGPIGVGQSPVARAPSAASAYANVAYPPSADIIRRPKSKGKKWIWLTIACLALLSIAGLGVAYSMDLVINPFDTDVLPSALPTLPSADTSNAGTAQATDVELTPTLPVATPVPIQHPTVNRPQSRPATPAAGGSSGQVEPSPSSSAQPPASNTPGGFGLPPFTLPSSLPSLPGLPSNLPPLPTSIAGIPIPPFMPGAQPSAAPTPSTP